MTELLLDRECPTRIISRPVCLLDTLL